MPLAEGVLPLCIKWSVLDGPGTTALYAPGRPLVGMDSSTWRAS